VGTYLAQVGHNKRRVRDMAVVLADSQALVDIPVAVPEGSQVDIPAAPHRVDIVLQMANNWWQVAGYPIEEILDCSDCILDNPFFPILHTKLL